ncbi:hypothetical protein K461DRAFT_41435 [Myriangium duriaei CBS 260.36]|uniref:Zn(2)-C6 fungal-type domain-containing protein n=1 Tax=Myriangium duriaei CBS 260.36 TaxID=1168546 RepID=A0A9P4MEJ2_9PEZI|nr:hypothetical protein K461DRAFT_41435 [Myriangium duriaei CBS 260.36]
MTRASSSNSSRYRKPHRTGRACIVCRQRKTRCDGREPVCGPCEKRSIGSACRYEYTRPKRHAEPQEIQAAPGQDPNLSHRVPYVPSFTPADDLFGSSSSVALSRRVAPHLGHHTPRGNTNPARLSSPLGSARRMTLFDVSLPTRRNGDAYVNAYFQFSWPLFPVLHESEFRQGYESLWTSGDNTIDDLRFFTILYLVFAIGCKHCANIEDGDKIRLAEEYHQKAQNSLDLLGLMDDPTLADIQSLLLMVVYLHSTPNAARCWSLHGLAVRLAHAVGLHLERPVSGSVLDPQVNTRRCIWHICVSLDRLNSMSFGHPMLDYTRSSTTPLPELDWDDNTSHAPDMDCPPLGLFISSCRLYEILAELLNIFQGIDQKGAKDDDNRWKSCVPDVLKICWQLDQFYSSVPQALQDWDLSARGPEADVTEARFHQTTILRCRYLLVRMLAYQPLLMITIPTKPGPTQWEKINDEYSHSATMLKTGCEACYETAYDLINLIWASMHSTYGSAPWHATYYIFTAAAILLATCRSSLMESKAGDQGFEMVWRRSLEVLQQNSQVMPVAAKAVDVLLAMRKEVIPSGQVETRDPMSHGTVVEMDPGLYPSWMFGTSLNSSEALFNGNDGVANFDWMHNWFGDFEQAA